MRDLNITNRSPAASDELQFGGKGTKRRASSPPPVGAREERPSDTGYDLYHRSSVQTLINTSSQAARYSQIQGLVSSSPLASHRSSYPSSSNLSIASITSRGSSSPIAVSPSMDTDFMSISPYAANHTLDRSWRCSLSQKPLQRKLSENIEQARNGRMSFEDQSLLRQNRVEKIQGLFICGCCPKKPKKFDTKEELE